MDAIIYTSESGFTAQYAALLGNQTGLPCASLKEAGQFKGKEVVYLGWLMAGQVKGLKKARKRFAVKAVCGVGMGTPCDKVSQDLVRENHLEDMPSFYLQGGFSLEKLHGIYHFMMKTMSSGMVKKLDAKPDKTEEEEKMLELFRHGGSFVSADNLLPVMQWMGTQL